MGYFLIPSNVFSKLVASLTVNLTSQQCRNDLVECVSQCIDISDAEKKAFMQSRGDHHFENGVAAFADFDNAVAKTKGLSMKPAAIRQRELRAKRLAKKGKKGSPANVTDGLVVQQI